MKAAIGVYESNEKALEAIEQLKKAGYKLDNLSIIGPKNQDEESHVKNTQGVEEAEVGLGAVGGTIVGALAGVGLVAIPGLGFLAGAGVLVGAIAGLEVGVVGGGLAAILTHMGLDKFKAHEYEKHLKDGKFMVIAQGERSEVDHAEKTLGDHGTHIELDTH